jgi:hypothetical protein
MRKDFAAFILTHGRPDRIYTLDTIRRFGYTGKVYLVVDDEDKTLPEYRRLYGDDVLVFSKREIAEKFDEGDNFEDRRAVIYARNACFELARKAGVKYFIQLDDDYTGFYFRFNSRMEYGVWRAECLDDVFSALLDYLIASPALSICMSQGGDHIAGASGFVENVYAKRKAMNTFVCDVDRPFSFFGRINEDVNTYTTLGRRGCLFLSIMSVQVNQKQTQSNTGGMTELYLDAGTYVKSFYSVMYCPSSVRVSEMGSSYKRIHHEIDWPTTAVQIISEKYRKRAKNGSRGNAAPARDKKRAGKNAR